MVIDMKTESNKIRNRIETPPPLWGRIKVGGAREIPPLSPSPIEGEGRNIIDRLDRT